MYRLPSILANLPCQCLHNSSSLSIVPPSKETSNTANKNKLQEKIWGIKT